ncbi:sensor histidine kinase [Anabaena azotica]|uniref:histidine kinase n=1 Tax=Anabaena azotica FACHB-119 TaxID=947527 RepID=A0ABR8DEE5_9NOST|nr:sensor histidine kinase [Anabaena azotica]MBD2505001.1 sensor histidine kinase [Anabaena azotica FACHB-119]
MQGEFFSKQLDLSALLHEVSNDYRGALILLNQLIEGTYGQSLEEIRPFLLALRDTHDRGISLLEANKVKEVRAISVTQFDMLALLQKTYDLFNPIAQCHSLKLHFSSQVTYKHGTQVRGESIGIDRMLSNLVSNAIKYTSRGEIFLRLLNQGDDLIVEIEDTGCGIPTEQLSNIFIPFWRSPNSSHRVGGKGLGLYIALSVAHTHELDIKVDSIPEQGTKFTIIFPYKENGIYGVDDSMLPKSHRRQDALPI